MSQSTDNGRAPEAVPDLEEITRLPEGGRERIGYVGLDRNERLGPLPEPVVEELRRQVDSAVLTTYPMLEDTYDQLAAHLGLDRSQLLLTPGSDAAVRALHQCYLRAGERTVSLAPSYAMYPIYARMFGGTPDTVAFDEHLGLDVDDLVATIAPGVRLVLIAEPNQPTGTALGEDALRAVLERAQAVGALLVVDEAYFPFSESTVLPWVAANPHLVVTRTFSKAWGLAGVRIGFVAAAPEVVQTLYKVRSAYDVNAVAAAAARVLLSYPQVAQDYADEVSRGRDVLSKRARALGLQPLDGRTNFLLLRVAARISPQRLVDELHDRRFIVKGPFTQPGLADCVRVTLGPPELMNRFADALGEVLDARG